MRVATFLRLLPAPSGRPVAVLVARYPIPEPGALEEAIERFERDRGIPRWQEAADVLRVG